MAKFDENFDSEQLADYLRTFISTSALEILSNEKIDGKKFTKLTKDALQRLAISEDDQDLLLDVISQVTSGGAMQDVHGDFTEPFCDIYEEESCSECIKLSKNQLVPEIHIVMHTLLPVSVWGWTGKGCSLSVYFEAKELGNWMDGHKLHQFQLQPMEREGYLYFIASVPVPIPVIRKYNGKLVYKYAVVTDGENWNFEKIFLCSKRDSRLLHIPKSAIIPQNTFRCYDTPVYPSVSASDKFDEVQRFSSTQFSASGLLPTREDDNRIRSISLICHLFQSKETLTSCFCNRLSASSLISELVNTITSVYHQVFDIYFYVTSHLLSSFVNLNPEKHYPASSKDHMKDEVIQWIDEIATTYFTEEGKSVNTHHCSIIAGAIFVLVIHELKLTETMGIDDLSCVMRLLHLISLPNKDQKCDRFLVMKNCLSTPEMEKQLSLAVKDICLAALHKNQGRSEEWIYPIPLFHFLVKSQSEPTSSAISAPFRPLPIKVENIKWLFWSEISNMKKKFQNYIHKKYNSYENFWENMIDWMELDPVLMKLLVFLCPEDQLTSILPRSPPIVAISFLIYILNRDKSETKKYNNVIHKSFTLLQHSVVYDDACKTIVNEVFAASKKLVQVFIDKINIILYHKEMLQNMMKYYFFIISNLCDQDNEVGSLNDVQEHVENWMLAVIGSGSVGGTNGKKLVQELEIWEMLLQTVASFCDQCEIWEAKIKIILENRAEQVDPNQKLELFRKANLSNDYHRFIIEVFIKMGVDGLSSLPGEEANKAITSLLNTSEDLFFIDQLLSCFIFDQFGENEDYKITIDDLINRGIWPSLIRIAKNENVYKNLVSKNTRKIIKSANLKVDNISQDIKNGNINFGELYKLVLNELKIQDVLNAADVEPRNIGVFKDVLDELHRFVSSAHLLVSNIGPKAIKGYNNIADDLRVPAESMLMNQLCIDWEKLIKQLYADKQVQGITFIRGPHLNSKSPLHSIIIPFGIMEQSKLFYKIWCKRGENRLGLSQDNFVKEVWIRSIDECKNLVDTCCDETAAVSNLESLFVTFSLDELNSQLKSLVKALRESNFYTERRNDDKWIENICLKIDYYRFSQQCERFSTFLLMLKEQLKLAGSCCLLQSFANRVRHIIDNTRSYQLKDINNEFLKTSDLLKNDLSDENVNCLQCLVEDSWDIVEWIGKSFKDVNELQTFVDVAITTDTDELNTLKLNSLRFIGNSVANFIPLLRNELTSSDDSGSNEDKSSYMIEICSGLWTILKQNHELPSLLKECTANLELYKSIKNSQGAVQVTTLQELDEIMNFGSFLIGTPNTAPYSEFQKLSVLSLSIKDSSSEITYDLEKIQDLESRLVLIAGQSSENNEKINEFLNVFHVAQVLADVLVKLQEQGCVKYIGWQCCFRFGKNEINQLDDEQKSMSRDLKLWEEIVDAARNDFYVLNSFTSKQLMRLRCDLVPHFIDGCVQFNINYQTYSLLKCLCPCVDESLMLSELKNSWLCIDNEGIANVQQTTDDNNITEPEDCDNEDNVMDVNVIVNMYLTEEQRSAFVELTESLGLSDDSLWVISEILMTDSDTLNTNDILLKIAELQEEKNEPSQDELLLNILNALKISNNLQTTNFSVNSASKSSTSTNREKPVTSAEVNIESLDICTMDCLSLQIMMKFLTLYTNNVRKHSKEIKQFRKLTEMEFFHGSPNLYVTSKANVLKTTLMFYAADLALPLPTQEEVLICNETTTAEEVILLWRRALFDPEHNRVFCLVHGEKLPYATCEESLQELNRLKQGKDGYRLAIICSNEYSGKSHFITALHSYRRTYMYLDVHNDSLQRYLENHLISPQFFNIGTSNCNSKTAAFLVDPQKSYVRVVYSNSSGNGKSLYIQRLGEKLMKEFSIKEPVLHIPIHGPSISINRILTKLCDLTCTSNSKIIHIDVPTMMIEAVETFLFSILILGNLQDHWGNTWRREISHMYIIEITHPKSSENSATFNLLKIFPSVACIQPKCTHKNFNYKLVAGMDRSNLASEEYQRVYQYLYRYDKKDNLDNYKYQHSPRTIMDNENKFVEIISKHANVKTWSDVHHYVKFLNVQLLACENSLYCNIGLREWSGFKNFVIKMMIQMSKEFTTSSITQEISGSDKIKQYELNRLWNNGFHPYVFFNKDNITFTFMGFSIDNYCNAVHPITKKVVMGNVLSKDLMDLLKRHKVDLSDNYLTWKKEYLLEKLGLIIGLEYQYCDPDPAYVITGDNVLKMMAILMRFRCGIPVVMMGETGCGKTKLLRYLCNLGAMDDIHNKSTSNMIILKVHGGTSHEDIEKAVNKAEERCMANNSVNQLGIGTVLFFDEANTTDHINLIKEIMCDHTIFGRPLHKDLRIVAACNPYRKHSEEMIKKLESAGLGFYTKATQTKEKLGSIPLRHLVYRVHDLPSSMASLVFDFGKLSNDTEFKYIEKIVENKMTNSKVSEICSLKDKKQLIDAVSKVLSSSQEFMKKRQDECGFVSLRDIDRALIIFFFFIELLQSINDDINKKAKLLKLEIQQNTTRLTRALLLTLGACYHARIESRADFEQSLTSIFEKPLTPLKSRDVFVNVLQCCQEVILDNMKLGENIARNSALRENLFMMFVCVSLRIPLFLVGKPGSSKSLAKSIIMSSMKGANSESKLLRNLKEVQLFSYQCSQLSTSNTIIKVFSQATSVQNQWNKSKYVAVVVLDEIGLAEDSPNLPLKTLHPLLEDGTDGNNFTVDFVNRDERVAFIGISNWALDPAKMNRGIMVVRGCLNLEELKKTALQICTGEGIDETFIKPLETFFEFFAKAYQEVLESQQKIEFYGLRDFYSLIKMLFWMCKSVDQQPNSVQIEHVIRRNFSGRNDIDMLKLFKQKLPECSSLPEKECCREKCEAIQRKLFKKQKHDYLQELLFNSFKEEHYKKHFNECTSTNITIEEYQKRKFDLCCKNGDFKSSKINQEFENAFQKYFNEKFEDEIWPFIINPDNSPRGLIISSLINKERTVHGESRYLLFLTENYSALHTLKHFLESPVLMKSSNNGHKPYIIFGSSFPKDKDFTKVYRNINNIKVCMETGRIVVLLNLESLYEGLYDVLNQYYVYFNKMRFVDLGLQNHRVKCRVHDDFKLILIAEKDKVYNEFPAALINRLEKHFVVVSSILDENQLEIEKEFRKFIDDFCQGEKFEPRDSFIGYQNDTPAAIVLKASESLSRDCDDEQVLKQCKFLLLQIASPDALIRLKKNCKINTDQFSEIVDIYTKEQHHSSLKDFLLYQMEESNNCRMQVTTCNDLLSYEEINSLKELAFDGKVITYILQEFDTEVEFSRKVRESIQCSQSEPSLLIIQCDSGHLNSDLIACAKYRIDDIWESHANAFPCYVLFTILIPREHNKSSFVSFLGGDWICVHIDDLYPDNSYSALSLAFSETPLSKIFYDDENDELNITDKSSEQISFNHCQFLYKNIAAILNSPDPDSKFAQRCHELNAILYRQLMVHPPMNCEFYETVVLFIHKHLKSYEMKNRDWIFNAASNIEDLQKGGSFVNVLLRNIDTIVNCVFSKIIMFADKNYNLSLIDQKNENTSPESRLFWMKAFSKLLDLNLLEENQQDIYDFHCQFPFSYYLHPAVESLLLNVQEEVNVTDQVQSKIQLLNTVTIADFKDMTTRYINDSVQLKWPVTYKDELINAKELQIISRSVYAHASNAHQKFSEIAYEIHRVLAKMEYEITCFKDLIALFPTILDKLEYDENLPLHLLAALCALDVMDDDHKSLKDNPNPRTIINKLHRFYQVSSSIDSTLSCSTDHEVCEKLRPYRLKWQGIQVMHLFIEHVMLNHGPYINKTIPFMARLRGTFVEKLCDFSQKATLRKLELLLFQMYKNFVDFHNTSDVADNFAQSCTRFYIAVVSNICMGNGTPDDDLVDKLLETIFNISEEVDELGQTRDLTPFIKSKNYDSVPVLRSYLLQLILQQNNKDTKKHIQKYFDKVEKIGIANSITDSTSKVFTQIKLLYCQLYENSLHNILLSCIPAYTELLERSQEYLTNNSELNLPYLEAVASIRYVLQYACKLIVTNEIDKDEDHIKFIEAIENACYNSKINSDFTGPHIFLLKILFRRLGESGLKRVLKNQRLEWILPERLTDNEESKMLDYFAIYQEKYTSVRKIVINVLAKRSDSDILNLLELNADHLHEHGMFFVLSTFMEITSCFKNEYRISRSKVQTFRKFIVGSTCKLSNELREISLVLLDNNFCASNAGNRIESLYIQPNQNPEDQIYASVVVHIATVFCGKKDLDIINFFYTIMSDPVKMKNAYWPSMPEDFGDDARRIIGGKAYECPNGHPYFVTECGRPMEEKHCIECKKQGKKVIIGGKHHIPKEGNKQRNKQCQTGYILGPAVESPAFPERTLSPASCTILKLFIHSALLWGCCACFKEEDISKIVSYDVPDDQLPFFFWKHLMVNFKCLQDLLSMSVDDAALLVHLITSNILIQPQNTKEPVYKLTTYEDKYRWEREFDLRYIRPILKKLQAGCLETAKRLLLEDERSNHPPLVNYVYERNITNFDINAHLWKYQPAITLEHLIQQLEVGGLCKTYPVLWFFLREETSLRATKYLPAIFRLQSYLYAIYHYRSSCKELEELSIQQFLDELTDDMKESVKEMIEQVNQAWELVRGKLQANGYHVLQNCIMGLSVDTPIIHLVPRQDCFTTTLVNYLVAIHNDFMTKSLKLIQEMHSTGRTWKSIRKDLTIKLKNIHKSHLLDFDAKLMPTILAHCHYSLTVGQDKTELEYDFEALEKQILNDFVYGKPKIEYNPVFVEYRKDVYTGMKIHMMKEKVKPQISLSEEAKKDLLKKLNRIQQLEEALNHIDIVIGFLAAGGQEDGNISLMEYGEKIVKIEDFNKTVGEGHCLGQVYSLWSAISVTLSKKVTLTRKLAFTVSKCFCEPMNMMMDSELEQNLKSINLEQVLYTLNEFIQVHVSNADENQAKWTIGECLGGHLGELKLQKNLRFLNDIPMCHIIKVWEKIVLYQNKHEAEIKHK